MRAPEGILANIKSEISHLQDRKKPRSIAVMDISLLNPLKIFGAQKIVSGILTGTIGYWCMDKFVIKPFLSKSHPEKICWAFEKQVTISCNWLLRKSVSMNDFMEDFKKKYPESGELIESNMLSSLERIQRTVNTTAQKVIENIKK